MKMIMFSQSLKCNQNEMLSNKIITNNEIVK